jgi:hypothetical protein
VSKLAPADIDSLVSEKLDAGYSVSTVRRMRTVLSEALDQAVRWGVVGRNVVSVTRGPRSSRREGRTLTAAQARELLASVGGHRLEAFFVTMLALAYDRERLLVFRGRMSTSRRPCSQSARRSSASTAAPDSLMMRSAVGSVSERAAKMATT